MQFTNFAPHLQAAILSYQAQVEQVNPVVDYSGYLANAEAAQDALSEAIPDFAEYEQACMFLGLA